jgi:hypothetical protein
VNSLITRGLTSGLITRGLGSEMKTYTNDTTTIVINYPRSWEPESLTDLKLQIDDANGNESGEPLMSATSASIYTETTVKYAVYRYDFKITLADGSEDLSIGDMVRIKGVLGYEDHTVKGYDAVNNIVTFEEHLDRDFEIGATINRLSAISTVDFSDTDTYPPGIQIVLTWIPTGTGASFSDLAEIEADDQIDLAAFIVDLKAVYPRAYDALTKPSDRIDTVIRIAQDHMRLSLASRGLDIARIKDQRLLTSPLVDLVAYLWARGGDVASADERDTIGKAYSASLSELCSLPLWVDNNGDGIRQNTEIQDYPVYFERVW